MTGRWRREGRLPILVAGADERPALVDAATGRTLSYAVLRAEIDRVGTRLAGAAGSLAVVRAANEVGALVAYLACLEHGVTVLPLDPAFPADAWDDLVARYRPAVLLGAPPAPTPGYVAEATDCVVGPVLRRRADDAVLVHPDLAVLLATSGSTGSPKLVRLSAGAVTANAASIVTALGITADDVAPTSLPVHYSYGLSVVHSHLLAGATLVVTAEGPVSRSFWAAVDAHRCTSLAGVPYGYQLLARLRFDPADHPSVRTLTQAGGRLGPDQARPFWEAMDRVGGRFLTMYGQTEATARMAVLPHERFEDKAGSAGLAVPGGRFVVDAADARDGGVGELTYEGPNVMMGYATGGADLARGDDQDGCLRTGDLGRLDDEGFVFLTGRAARIAKVFGVRVSLDDVEDLVRGRAPAAAVSGADRLVVFTEGPADDARATARAVAERLRVHPTGVDVRPVDRLPLLPNGKVDYRALEAAL